MIIHRLRAAAAWFAATLMLGATVVGISASSAASPPAFGLSTDRSAIGLTGGAQTAFRVTISSPDSWQGKVKLDVTGAPAHTRISTTPATVATDSSAIVAIIPTGAVATGTYHLHVVARAGPTSHRRTVVLTASRPRSLQWSVRPVLRRVVEGHSVTYRAALLRGTFTGAIRFRVIGLPAGAKGTVRNRVVHASAATVHVQLNNDVVPRAYRFYILGRAEGRRGVILPVYLVVVRHHLGDFPVSGDLDRTLAPGVTGQLDLTLTNPFTHSMRVSGITVRIVKTNQTGCSPSNFKVTQYAGPSTLVVPAHASRTLSQLKVSNSALPKLTMLDLAVNQDLCKNTTIALAYTASGVDK